MEQGLDGGNVTGWVSDSLKGLPDDIECCERCSKEQTGDVGDGLIAIGFALRGGHRGRCADAHQLLSLHAFSDTAHEHGDIRTLPAAVRVEFVQHQELQPATVVDHAAVDVFEAREDQLQHHEVGEQNVRRVVGDCLALVAALLAGVALDAEGLLPCRIAVQELVQLFQLAVGQCVHRVDDDGACAGCGIRLLGLENAVDDRDEEGQRLARPGAGGDDVALVVLGLGNSLHLMLVEMQVRRLAFDLASLEQRCARWMQAAVIDELLYCAVAPVVGIDLNERLRPIASLCVLLVYPCSQVVGSDARKAARKRGVLVDEPVTEIEDVLHFLFSPCSPCHYAAPVGQSEPTWGSWRLVALNPAGMACSMHRRW